jgi:hypothetical protein
VTAAELIETLLDAVDDRAPGWELLSTAHPQRVIVQDRDDLTLWAITVERL